MTLLVNTLALCRFFFFPCVSCQASERVPGETEILLLSHTHTHKVNTKKHSCKKMSAVFSPQSSQRRSTLI